MRYPVLTRPPHRPILVAGAWRLHCGRGESDKVYFALIVRLDDGTFGALAAWGRRGATPSWQWKQRGVSRPAATELCRRLAMAKEARGYDEAPSLQLPAGCVAVDPPAGAPPASPPATAETPRAPKGRLDLLEI